MKITIKITLLLLMVINISCKQEPALSYKQMSSSKEKSKEDQKIISILMGDDVAPRKEFITSNALEVANLDI